MDDAVMRAAAEVAARVLADLWPAGGAVVRVDVHELDFLVSAERDGVVVSRTGEVRRAWLRDVVDLGGRRPERLPVGARELVPGRVSVELPRARFRRPRPRHWTGPEVEALCRRLNAIDAEVLGIVETGCRVCGFDEGDERWVGGVPEYVICPRCGSESGVDDLR